jgi:hypothetical protein
VPEPIRDDKDGIEGMDEQPASPAASKANAAATPQRRRSIRRASTRHMLNA